MSDKSAITWIPMPPSMVNWTTEPPTQEGWYWAKNRENGNIEIIEIDSWNHSAYRAGQNAYVLKTDFTHWLSPLPVPEPPNG